LERNPAVFHDAGDRFLVGIRHRFLDVGRPVLDHRVPPPSSDGGQATRVPHRKNVEGSPDSPWMDLSSECQNTHLASLRLGQVSTQRTPPDKRFWSGTNYCLPGAMSAPDAVDGCFSGTRVPRMRVLLMLPRFGGANHARPMNPIEDSPPSFEERGKKRRTLRNYSPRHGRNRLDRSPPVLPHFAAPMGVHQFGDLQGFRLLLQGHKLPCRQRGGDGCL